MNVVAGQGESNGAPHSPANTAPVDDHAGQEIDIAYVGACTGAKLDDLRMVVSVLRGRCLASNVTLMIAPASKRDQKIAEGGRDHGSV